MAKAEWGLKRTCQSCGARFYDLSKSPISCPKCGAEYDPEVLLKSRRGKPAPVVPKPAPVEEPEPVEAEAAEGEEEEEDAVIEDTSELGEDEEDVAEVIENVEDEER
ncbi:MAG: TIGR02300 family protein [Rhodospirillales bacterium]|nr:TIGR02300 family protein [Rhodospirillales bacterium]